MIKSSKNPPPSIEKKVFYNQSVAKILSTTMTKDEFANLKNALVKNELSPFLKNYQGDPLIGSRSEVISLCLMEIIRSEETVASKLKLFDGVYKYLYSNKIWDPAIVTIQDIHGKNLIVYALENAAFILPITSYIDRLSREHALDMKYYLSDPTLAQAFANALTHSDSEIFNPTDLYQKLLEPVYTPDSLKIVMELSGGQSWFDSYYK